MEGDKTYRDQCISDRIQENQHSEAKAFFEDYDKNKREELYDVKEESDVKNLDSRQKEAIDRVRTVYEPKIEEIYVDRSFLEKIVDFDLNRKMQLEHTTSIRTETAGPDR